MTDLLTTRVNADERALGLLRGWATGSLSERDLAHALFVLSADIGDDATIAAEAAHIAAEASTDNDFMAATARWADLLRSASFGLIAGSASHIVTDRIGEVSAMPSTSSSTIEFAVTAP